MIQATSHNGSIKSSVVVLSVGDNRSKRLRLRLHSAWRLGTSTLDALGRSRFLVDVVSLSSGITSLAVVSGRTVKVVAGTRYASAGVSSPQGGDIAYLRHHNLYIEDSSRSRLLLRDVRLIDW
jgi:hypothetical protein